VRINNNIYNTPLTFLVLEAMLPWDMEAASGAALTVFETNNIGCPGCLLKDDVRASPGDRPGDAGQGGGVACGFPSGLCMKNDPPDCCWGSKVGTTFVASGLGEDI